MGCIPIRTVTDNPDVTLHSRVGRTTIFTKLVRISYMQGLLYVRDNQLCCEARAGSRLCCKVLKKTWDLSQVKRITIIQQVTLVAHSHHRTWVQPGLKITLQDAILYVATPDPVSLSTQLVEQCERRAVPGERPVLENSSTHTVVYTQQIRTPES